MFVVSLLLIIGMSGVVIYFIHRYSGYRKRGAEEDKGMPSSTSVHLLRFIYFGYLKRGAELDEGAWGSSTLFGTLVYFSTGVDNIVRQPKLAVVGKS